MRCDGAAGRRNIRSNFCCQKKSPSTSTRRKLKNEWGSGSGPCRAGTTGVTHSTSPTLRAALRGIQYLAVWAQNTGSRSLLKTQALKAARAGSAKSRSSCKRAPSRSNTRVFQSHRSFGIPCSDPILFSGEVPIRQKAHRHAGKSVVCFPLSTRPSCRGHCHPCHACDTYTHVCDTRARSHRSPELHSSEQLWPLDVFKAHWDVALGDML